MTDDKPTIESEAIRFGKQTLIDLLKRLGLWKGER